MTLQKPIREPVGEPTPAPISSGFPRREQAPRSMAQIHAERLLAWLRIELANLTGESRTFLTNELKVSYVEMCAEYRLVARPWNPVAAHFAVLIRQRGRPPKTYTDLIDKEGRKRRPLLLHSTAELTDPSSKPELGRITPLSF